MRSIWTAFFVFTMTLLTGCSVIQSGKMLAPESFGLTQITPHLYVEDGADAALKAQLQEAMTLAEAAVRANFGDVQSRPSVHACVSQLCFEALGGRGERAKVFGRRILLSPQAHNWHLIAHEWSHAEMSTRLGFWAWKRMPQWFDEGLAVLVSQAPEHSQAHWQFLVHHQITRPTRDELLALKSLKQWVEAFGRYNQENIQRKAKGESEISPVYAAAGHEVAIWFAQAGTTGLLKLIERLNNGADFDAAYQPGNTSWESAAPSPKP